MAGDVAQLDRRGVALRQVQNVREMLQHPDARTQLAAVAANHLRPERMLKIVATALRTTPKLGECDPLSLLGSLMTCASLGLEPSTPLGHAYLVPFWNGRKKVTEVQLIIGYKGLIDLARRSGHVRSIHADVVYDDDDEWSYEYGSRQHLRHRPGPREGSKLYAYCHCTLTDGEAFVVLPWSHVMRVRDGSQGYQRAKRKNDQTTPWIKFEDEMAAKTAIRALAKRLPMSIEMAVANDIDERSANFSEIALDAEAIVRSVDDDNVIDAEPAAQSDPEPSDPPAKPQPRPEPEPEKEDAPLAAEAPSVSVLKKANDLIDRLRNEIVDPSQIDDPDGRAQMIDAALSPYTSEIEWLKTQAPGRWATFEGEIAQAKAGRA